MATRRSGLRTGRVAVRVLACLAVVPIGLGPSMVAFAQVDTSSDPTTTQPPTTTPATTPATTPITAPATTTSTTTTTEAATTTTAASTTTEVPVTADVTTTSVAPPTNPSTTIVAPTTGTTIAPVTTIPPPAPVPNAASTTSTSDPASDPALSSTTSTDATTTTIPETTTTEPVPAVLNIAVPPPTETLWTLGLRYTGGTTYSGPYQLYLRSQFGGSTVGLRDGEVSAPLARGLGVDYFVRVEMGSSYDPGFPFRWECTGSDSGLQLATSEQFVPAVSDLDATMDCVFVIDNTNAPIINIVTEVEGDAAGAVSFDYDVRYNFFGDWPIGTHNGTDGTSVSYDGMAEFRTEVTATATGSTPATTSTSIVCRDAGGAFITSSATKVSLSPANGANVTCTATHTVRGTLKVIEDVIPPVVPPGPVASYLKSGRSLTGPSTWTLADGESEDFVFPVTASAPLRITRTEVPGWDLTGVECLENLGGGATAPYAAYSISLGSRQGALDVTLPPPGTDLECTFLVEPAGPPSLSLNVNVNVVDRSAYSDIDIEVRDSGGTLVDTITVGASGGGQTIPLDTGDSSFTLEIIDSQGLGVDWTCDAVTSSTDTISFPTILGETTRCQLAMAEPFPSGTGSILLTKDEDPDNGESYSVSVRLGDFLLGSDRISEGGGGLLIPTVADGIYTISETGLYTNYELTAVDCVNATASAITRSVIPGVGEDGSAARRGEFTLDTRVPGSADVECKLVNTPNTDPAIIRIETVGNPTGSADTFDYTIDPSDGLLAGTSTFSQGDGAVTSRGVEAGRFFTISQDPDVGYATTVGCGVTGALLNPDPGLEGFVFAEPGVDYTCRFVNTAIAVSTATLELVTEVEPDTGINFSYDLTPTTEIVAPSPTTVDQTDGETATITTTAGAAIAITHTSPFGYETSAACVDGPTTISTGASTVTYTPAADSTVRCTFTHRRLASLTIIESVAPDGLGAPEAIFTVGPAGNVAFGPTRFDLADDQQETVLLDAGEVTSVLRDGPVELTSTGAVRCVETLPGGGVVDYTPTTAAEDFLSVTPDVGDAISCSFLSTQSPAPVLTVRNIATVFDPTAFADFDVVVTGPTGEVGRLAVPLNDAAPAFDLEPATGYTVTVADDQGLTIAWLSCAGTAGGPGSSISFTTTTLGTRYSCAFRSTEPLPAGTGSLTVGIDHVPDSPSAVTDLYVGVGPFEITMSAPSITGDGSVTASGLPDATYDGVATYRYDEIVTGISGDPSCRLGGTTVEYSGGGVDRSTSFRADIVGGAATSCTLEFGPVEPVALVTVATDTGVGIVDDFTYVVEPSPRVIGEATFVNATGDATSFDVRIGGDFTVTQTLPDSGYETTVECTDDGGVVVGTGDASVTIAPGADDMIFCVFDNQPLAPSVTVRTVTDPFVGPDAYSFDYAVQPAASLISGTSPFVQGNTEESVLVVDPAVAFGPTSPTITQAPDAGYTTRVGCFDPLTETAPAVWISGVGIQPDLRPGQSLVCVYENTAVAATAYDVTIDVVVDTGVIDVSGRYQFFTVVSGAGVDGATGVGTDRNFFLQADDSVVVSVAGGTEATIEPEDLLVGPDGFRSVIDCSAAAAPTTNAPSTFTVDADVACTVTFTARTITVSKTVGGPPNPAFDVFDFNIQPEVELDNDFSLSDGEEFLAVVPIGQSIELFEYDPGPYGVIIECTEQTATGPIFPFTGPLEFSNFIDITDLATSFYCVVFNEELGPIVHEVTVESEFDFGGLDVPSDLPGFLVDFDGDLAFFEQLEDGRLVGGPQRAGGTDLTRSGFVIGSSALVDSRFVDPDGSVSVFVEDGGSLDIAAGAGSGRFANAITCPGATTAPDGSASLTGISGAVTCTMTSAAGALRVINRVTGPTTVTDWPFTISNVLAGPSSTGIAANGSVTVAVEAGAAVTITQTDVRGATSVTSSCQTGLVASFLRAGGVEFAPSSRLASMLNTARVVSVAGGDAQTCTFVNGYPTITTPTTTTTTTTVAPPTTGDASPPPASPPTAPTSTPTTGAPTSTVPTPIVPTAAAPPQPTIPFSPAATPTTDPGSPSTPATTPTGPTPSEPPSTEPPSTAPPTSGPPATDPPTTEPPSDDPPVIITEVDTPEEIFVDIGDPIPVDVDCAGELVITVNGIPQERADQIEPSALGLGDHVISVSCDGEEVTSVRAVVFEQEESSPAGRNMAVIVMFVVMASAAFLFAPSAAGRKRLPS